MDLHLAANYDLELIDKVADGSVSTVYGKCREDFVGGGRASYMGKQIGFTELAWYIRKLKERGLEFSYLLNSSCLGNREWNRCGQKKLQRFLKNLLQAGVERVTVSTPFLFKLIKKRYPEIKITVGIYAQVDTVERVKFWDELGADAITLESFSINRDFKLLGKIRQSTDKELILLANHICLLNCPLQPYHQNCFSHASTLAPDFFVDYCYLECNRRRFDNPESFISSQWIRPEDIGRYIDMGYETFKLLERDLPSEVLLNRVRAYEKRQYRGNLADLLVSHSFGRPKIKAGFRYFLKQLFQAPLKSLLQARKFMQRQGLLYKLEQPPVNIKADQIPPDFLDRVVERDCLNSCCSECGFCKKVAERAVELAEDGRLAEYSAMIEQLESGEFWNV